MWRVKATQLRKEIIAEKGQEEFEHILSTKKPQPAAGQDAEHENAENLNDGNEQPEGAQAKAPQDGQNPEKKEDENKGATPGGKKGNADGTTQPGEDAKAAEKA